MSVSCFHSQCSLLAELAKDRQVESGYAGEWTTFVKENEIGILLSLIYSERFTDRATTSAMEMVSDTYTKLCAFFAVDSATSFDSIEELLAASPYAGTAISPVSLGQEALENDSNHQHWDSSDVQPVSSTDALSHLDVAKIARLTGFDVETIREAVNGDWLAQNDVGDALMYTPEIDTALMLLRESACQGAPWAVATYTWHCLKTQQFTRARDLFAATASVCQTFVQMNTEDDETAFDLNLQWANCRSNDALCALAIDADDAYALDVWADGAETEHPESMFYPALIYWKAGKRERARRHLEELDSDVLSDVVATLTECVESAEGWFRSWCQEGLEMLEEFERTQKPAHDTPASTQSFCSYCGAHRKPDHSFCVSCGQKLD